mgnify:CR=1 FL=1|jgi:hypothetical protein
MNARRQIIVIGDSHSRSFVDSDYFIPIFIGAGKFNNFTNEHEAKTTEKRLLQIMSHFKKDDYFLLTFGEPDCRWNTYNSWHPLIPVKPQNNKIINSISNFKKSILKIKPLYENLIIYNAIPHTRGDQNAITQIWNKNVSTFCEENDLFFCDIYDEVLKDLDSHLVELSGDRGIDPVHLGTSIQELVIKKLQNTRMMSIAQEPLKQKIYKIIMDNSFFEYDERFKCFFRSQRKLH